MFHPIPFITIQVFNSPFYSIIKEQIKLRDNALQQAEMLLAYKRAVCHHPSHQHKHLHQHHNKEDSSIDGVLSVFVSLLADPLSKQGSQRAEADRLTIELVFSSDFKIYCPPNLSCTLRPIPCTTTNNCITSS